MGAVVRPRSQRSSHPGAIGQRPPGIHPRPRRRTSLLVLGCVLGLIGAMYLAWQQPGFPEVPPEPVDDSVWVANAGQQLVGRINTGIGELDSAAQVRLGADVLQDPVGSTAGTVLVLDGGKHELQLLDTATVTFGARVSIPENAVVQLRGGTLAVVDQADGRLWVGAAGSIGSVDSRTADPLVTLGPMPVLAVSRSGTVFGTAAGSDTLVRVDPGAAPVTTTLPDGALSLGSDATAGVSATLAGVPPPAQDIQLTTVGDIPVLLDRGDDSLRVDGRRFMLPETTDAVLQQPGPAAPEVLIATGDGLRTVSLEDGGMRTIVDAPGVPVAPVVAARCGFGAWVPDGRSPGTAVRAIAACPNPDEAPAGDVTAVVVPEAATASVALDGSDAASAPVFRQHGSAVVLGDADTGQSWIAGDGYRRVSNWSDVAPPDTAEGGAATVDDPSTQADLPRLPPDCTSMPIGEPLAVDDRFGVRAGRTTVLRVLDNDPSVDCTSVVIDSVTPLPAELGTVAIVDGGGAIQVTVPATATGTLPPVDYRVGNGRGGTAAATARIDVVPADRTAPPELVRRSAVGVEVNGAASYNVVADFRSPTGDDLFLLSASSETADAVSFRPDGTINYRNVGVGAGTDSPVTFVVSDGVRTTTGTLTVSIAAAGSSTPVAYPSSTTAVLGATAVAHPLRSVVSAAGPVTIGTVQPDQGSEAATARLDPRDQSVVITATDPGSYYFSYEAATAGRAVTGVLRADFVAPSDPARSVVPMTDVAYLPAGGQTVLDPLANDTDPDDQGLAVQAIDVAVRGPDQRRGDRPAAGAGVRNPPAGRHRHRRVFGLRRHA